MSNLNFQSDSGQPQLKVPFDVDFNEPRQQSCAVRQKDDASEVQWRLLRLPYSVSDMKEGLERAR
jgi:hypothetical protein